MGQSGGSGMDGLVSSSRGKQVKQMVRKYSLSKTSGVRTCITNVYIQIVG